MVSRVCQAVLVFTITQQGEDSVVASSTRSAWRSRAWALEPGCLGSSPRLVTHWLPTLAKNPYLCADKVVIILFLPHRIVMTTKLMPGKHLGERPDLCALMIPTIILHT